MTLETQPIIRAIKSVSERATDSLTIFAPYITSGALVRVLAGSPANTIDVVTTWNSADVAAGYSDTTVYELLASVGGNVRLLPGLHLKAVIGDFSEVFIGSANITSAGIGIHPKPNIECGVVRQLTREEATWFRSLLKRSQVVTRPAYEAFLRHLKNNAIPSQQPGGREFDWSPWCLERRAAIPLLPDPDILVKLWTNSIGISEDMARRFYHDAQLLGLSKTPPSDPRAAREAIRDAYIALPLIQDFLRFVGEERFFGAIRRWVRRRLPTGETLNTVNEATRRLLIWTTKLCANYTLERPHYSYRLACRPAAYDYSRTSSSV